MTQPSAVMNEPDDTTARIALGQHAASTADDFRFLPGSDRRTIDRGKRNDDGNPTPGHRLAAAARAKTDRRVAVARSAAWASVDDRATIGTFMRMSFADRLHAAIAEKGSPICVGIDPMYDALPPEITGERRDANDAARVIDCYYKFVIEVLNLVAPHVPIVKFQSAYFEQYHGEGVEAYYSLIHEAKQLGLLTIGDAKRGDIGSTSAAYAAGHLDDFAGDAAEEYATPDALTVNPMLGMDALEPFVTSALASDKGLFVLVRTSNPGSRDFQDVALEGGKTWSEHVADTLQMRIAQTGVAGYSSIGAVVGATQTHTMRSMRRRLPQSIFLLPGYGTQGATAEMTRAAFDAHGQGAIVSASRSILYAKGDDWRAAIERAVTTMRNDLAFVGRA